MRFIKLSTLSVLLLITCQHKAFAQTIKNYEPEWKKVDSFVSKNLPKSALAEVKNIYERAKKEKQEAQIIKSLVYTISLQQENREEAEAQAIKDIEGEIALVKEPAASILKSVAAGLYWQYFQQNRWKLYNRTAIANFIKEDVATWTAEDFHRKISDLYLQSIKGEKGLKATKPEAYEAIIVKGNVRPLRPTLFDLLAHKALEYFKNDERDMNKPAYAFEITEPEAFAPAAQFAAYPFTTNDSLSLQHKALLIYQELIRFHLNDVLPNALIDVDIDRIQFVHQHSTLGNKEEAYLSALQGIADKHQANRAATQALYLIAAHHEQQAGTYHPDGDTTHRFSRVKARDLLEKIVSDSAVKEEGWTNGYNLLKEVTRKELLFSLEKVTLPGQPFRSLVQYRNIERLTLKIVKSDDGLRELAETDFEKYWTAVQAAPPIRTWQQALPPTGDLQKHSVEIKIDSLPLGEYILVASNGTQEVAKNSIAGIRLFYVSNISYVHQENRYFVLHRQSGQPLAQAKVQVLEQLYKYTTSRYREHKGARFTTDKNGFFSVPAQGKNKRRESFLLDISHNNDRLKLDERLYQTYYSTEPVRGEDYEKRTTRIYLFTDRSLYRPGQLIYLKGIAVNNKAGTKQSQVLQQFNTQIYLHNANHQVVDSVQVTTNEWGSFSTTFTLPQGVLNGSFTLAERGGRSVVRIRVEEYKRPKFYVEYQKIKGTYKAGDTISITGEAKAYAGNSIDGATVRYRVVRQPRFLYPWLIRRRWQPPTEAMEITHGETTTGAAGNFAIRFAALPDAAIDKKLEPVFDFKIYADITDVNGETRSGVTTVSAGYKSIILTVDLAQTLFVDSLKAIKVRTENMNGGFKPASVLISIYELRGEQRLIRERLWEAPDQYLMSREEFIRHFPHDEYKNESEPKSWERVRKVFEKADSSAEGKSFIIRHAFLPGYYAVEVEAKDVNGTVVKDVRYLQLIDQTNKLAQPVYLFAKGTDAPIEPGEKTLLQIGSSASVFVVQQINRKSSNTEADYNFLTLNNEKKTFSFSASEEDRGGYGISYFFIKDNRFYQFDDVVQVPWSNKEVTVEYATFRDKTLPGSEEKWTLKISGYKKEKVAAEMVASMYDASLDQFYPHGWNKPGLWPVYGAVSSWNGTMNFMAVQSQQKWNGDDDYKHFYKAYDQLLLSRHKAEYNSISSEVIVVSASKSKPNGRNRQADVSPFRGNKFTPPQIANDEELQRSSALTDTVLNENQIVNNTDVRIRKNFNETAFFFPHLYTGKDGSISFSFTLPDALTRWKFQALTHTKELAIGLSQKEIITQKQLMVQPNAPRFLRQGDRLELSAKIVNLTDKEITGQTQLELMDATTNASVDGWFQNIFPNQYVTIAAGGSEVVKFPIEIPFQFQNALVWRIVARAGTISDGEEAAMPVLTNKVLVTETLPLPIRGTGSKNVTFEKLLKAKNSETLVNQSLAVEYTSNPTWFAVQALPYLAESSIDCAEAYWNRYYANSIASSIVTSLPRIKQIMAAWQASDTTALLSNLQKNEELKSALLQETPWVLQAKSEGDQKKSIALLFDAVRMSKELKAALEKLKGMQSSNGGFVWFKGGPDDRYMTQYIITGIGHLRKLKATSKESEDALRNVVATAIPYLDKKINEDYNNLINHKVNLKAQNINALQIQYLYMRSFFPEYSMPQATQAAYAYYRQQAKQYWTKENKYMQGMIALCLHRAGDKQTPADILNSLKETAINNEELGMYWKDVSFGYSWFWWHAPIETQSLLIEAFSEINKDTKVVTDLKTWLLKNKQTNNWRSTKATAEACYALLAQGSNWVTAEPLVHLKLGSTMVSNNEDKREAGTGYFKKVFTAQQVQPEMGNITFQVGPSLNNSVPAEATPSWGALYWQYFEDMDNVTAAATPLQLSKKLFVETNSDRGPVLTPVSEGAMLNVGNKIKVRVELRVDRDMEYVHMKDMRASAFEPVNVLSSYKWQGGLGYYETTKDASTSFFFSYLRKGTYVFEYSLFVTHSGTFSNGITTIQSLYAPEFSAHSEGVKIRVE